MTNVTPTNNNDNTTKVTYTEKLNIVWKKDNRKDGTKFKGTVNSKHGETFFYIKKTIGGFSYKLFLGESILLHQDSDSNYLKIKARDYI